MNKLTRTEVLGIILLAFAVGIYFYPTLPAIMASHWNISGEVNGSMTKFWGTFSLPTLSLALFLVFLLIPKIDPLKENYEKFGRYFDGFILVLELFLFYLYILTIVWNLGYRFDMTGTLTPALGILFYYIGILLEQAKPNWFIGIRNPWTLSSEEVWNKTNKLGGGLYKAAGVIAILGILAGGFSIFFVLIPIVAVSIYLTIYSYLEFNKQSSRKK
jgi:uncharacterized membrane protein